MNLYKKFYFVGLIFLLSVSFTYAQKKKTTQKKQTVTSSRKVTNLRLVPPANREFNHRFTIDVSYDKFANRTKVQMRLPINSVESVHFCLTAKR